jgi:hypothetical protein
MYPTFASHNPLSSSRGTLQRNPSTHGDGNRAQPVNALKVNAMAEAGFWVAWGLPTEGRERQALDLLNETKGYLERIEQERRIERFDIAILKPQTTELGGFILIQGTQEQIDSLRHDTDFQVWVNRVQLVADRVGIVDAWVDQGITEATNLYEEALRKAGLVP